MTYIEELNQKKVKLEDLLARKMKQRKINDGIIKMHKDQGYRAEEVAYQQRNEDLDLEIDCIQLAIDGIAEELRIA